MENVVLTVHLILALLLIGVVLLQRSEGGGLGIGGGGGSISARGAATALGKVTWLLAAGFITTSVTLTILSAGTGNSNSVADQIGIEAPKAEEPTLPATDLLPPAPTDAPATPQKAED